MLFSRLVAGAFASGKRGDVFVFSLMLAHSVGVMYDGFGCVRMRHCEGIAMCVRPKSSCIVRERERANVVCARV